MCRSSRSTSAPLWAWAWPSTTACSSCRGSARRCARATTSRRRSYINGDRAAEPNKASERFAARGRSQWLSVVPSVEPVSPEGEALIKRIRALDAPSEVLVGGASARLVDSKDAIFGLSMDYEVFLLSRIKEEHDRTGDNTASVALGLERTGRIVTAAAVLLSVTFLAFGTSDITFIKLFGLGLALAVVMDATIVRGLLVPAFMRLAGEANWWAPAWMRRVHDRIGFNEAGPSDHDETPTGPRAETPV